MPGARQHRQARARHHALDQQRRLEAQLVLVAAHDQQRHVDGGHRVGEVVQRRAASLIALHREGRAGVGVRSQLPRELGEAARVLAQVLQPRGAVAVGGHQLRHAVAPDRRRALHALALPRAVDRGVRARAHAHQRERQRARRGGVARVLHAEVQRREGAHRAADHVRLAQLQRVEHRDDVVALALLLVVLRALRHVARRIAARVVGDAAVRACEVAQLRLPAAMVAGELVHEHERRAAAGLFVVQVDAVVGADRGHALSSVGVLSARPRR
jgi:hypothetical protein